MNAVAHIHGGPMTIARADVEGWKSIAAYIERASGLTFSWETARKHSRYRHGRLRVRRAMGGRIYALREDLDAFVSALLAPP